MKQLLTHLFYLLITVTGIKVKTCKKIDLVLLSSRSCLLSYKYHLKREATTSTVREESQYMQKRKDKCTHLVSSFELLTSDLAIKSKNVCEDI